MTDCLEKNTNINKSYINYTRTLPGTFTDLLENETYCRFLWTSKKRSKKQSSWQVIGQSNNQKTTSLLDFKLSCLSEDVFMSPNQFFNWRNSRQLARLNAMWVEIDTKNHKILSEKQEGQILDEVFQQLAKSALPSPNAYVLSGSGGIHLYWIFEQGVEAYRYRVEAWRQIAKKITSVFTGGALWEVDAAASHDPVRVLRLPGSIHGKSKRVVHAYTDTTQTITFEELAAHCRVDIKRPTYPSKTQGKKQLTPEQKQKKAQTSRHTIGQWWAKTYFQVLNHSRQKGKEQLRREKKRDLVAFILYVALRHIKGSTDAFKELEKINNDVIGLDSSELNAYLQTALKVKYKFKKDTLAKYVESLGINSDYLYVQKPKTSPEQIKKSQSLAGYQTAKKRREATYHHLKQCFNGIYVCIKD